MSICVVDALRFPWEQSTRGRGRGTKDDPNCDPAKVENPFIRVPANVLDLPLPLKDRDDALFALHKLLDNPIRRRDGWIPFGQRYQIALGLQPTKVRLVLTEMERLGVVEKRPSQRRGQSDHYRPLPPFRKSKRVRVRVTKKTILKRMWKAEQHLLRPAYPADVPVYAAIDSNLHRLTWDADAPIRSPKAMRVKRRRVTIGKKGGRVYSFISNLRKSKRRYLRVAGSAGSLWQADVSQCQPWILIRLLQDSGFVLDAEFVADVRLNRMYDRWAAEIGTSERDQAKASWVKLVFGFPRRYNGKHLKAFSTLYPKTWAAIAAYGSAHPGVTLCSALQRVESDVIVRNATAMFVDMQPGVFIYPLHDALIVERGQTSFAEWCLQLAFEHRFGEVPKIASKPFANATSP